MDLTEEERPEQHTPLPVRKHTRGSPGAPSAPEAVYRAYVPGVTAPTAPEGEPQREAGDLPEARADADLAPGQPRARWTVAVFAISLIVFVAFVPRFLRFSNPPTGDQPFYLMDTISVVEDGDLNVFNNYGRMDEKKFYPPPPEQRPSDFVGIAAPFPLPAQLALTPARPETEWYSAHMPGLSFVIAPGWWVGSWFGQGWTGTIVVMCILGALLGTNVFLGAYQVTGRLGIALAVWAPVVFASPVWSYSYLIFTEMPTGLLLIYAFRRLAMGWGANEWWRLGLVGASIGFIPWMAWRCVPLALVLGLYAAVQWMRFRRQRAGGAEALNSGGLKSAAAFLAPVATFAALAVVYTYFRTGSMIPNTAQQARDVVEPFNWPWQGEHAFALFVRGAFGQLYDQRFGLLVYSPIYLLAAVGVVAMFRTGRGSDRRLLAWIGALVVPYYFLLSAYAAWHGIWSPPSRYLATLVPLAAFPLAMSLRALGQGAGRWARWAYRAVYALLALVGPALMGVMLADGRTMWPGDPIFDWIATAPESLLKVDLRQHIPTFILASSDYRVMVGDFNLPRTTAIWVGASVAVVLLFSWAMFRAGAFRQSVVPGLRPRGLAAVTVGALAVVAAGWWGMNAEFFQPVTTLTPVQTWRLQEGIKTPRGITLREGKAYITDYEGPTVAELDLATGAYRLIQPVGSSGIMTYTHPGDVQFGPDGLFYVLNNGTGNDALYAMTLDGQVQRRIALGDKADISVGLRFTQDGEMLVTDMRRGALLWYGPEGGTPRLGSVGEAQRGFNNLNGITLDGDGNIYAFEGSGFRVQVLDRRGAFVRDYKLTCQPIYGAVRDGWLDVTCERGLISINLETGRAQPSWIADAPVQNQYMVGMAYGPDGTLYVVQQEGLVAYRVQH